MADWLFDPGSLTQRLRALCGNCFRVHVLSQRWSRPRYDEAHALQLRLDAWAWTREVQLLCGDQPWVFARTLIPMRTLNSWGRRLTQLGNKPLGAVLFADHRIQRGPVEIAQIPVRHRLHERAFVGFSEPPDTIWGRRSVFQIADKPLLVSEIFLPELLLSAANYRTDLTCL